MSIALILRVLVILQSVLFLSSCSITERLIPAIVEERQEEIIVTSEGVENITVTQDWLTEYIHIINGLPHDSLHLEYEINEGHYAENPSVANHAKLVLSAMAIADPQNYEAIASLIGDKMGAKAELTEEWQFFVDRYVLSLNSYKALQDKFDSVVAEKEQMIELNARIKGQLLEAQSEKAKLENQLKELKSIEASLIQRDIREDVPVP